jgi:hypothetical protein
LSNSSICSGVFPMMELIIDAKMTKAQARTAHRIEHRQAGWRDDTPKCAGKSG